MSKKVYILAGELSGDMHGAGLMKSLLEADSSVQFLGSGGPKMKAIGGTEDWLEKSAVMGVVEVLKQYKWFKQQLERMLEEIKQQQPDLLVLIDYPKYNLTLAKMVREAGIDIKIAYYISPKVWAWNKGRVPVMAELLDKMLCIFPFEVEIFEEHNLPTTYVGNPLVDELGPIGSDEGRDENLIGLFPGSREREVAKLFPVMVDAAARLQQRNKEWRFEVPAATPALAEQMYKMLDDLNLVDTSFIKITDGGSHELMRKAHCGVVASGTATLEAAWLGMPYCLVYKVAWPTYMIAKMLLKIQYIGLVNILAGEEVVEEYVQGEADPCHVERALERFLTDGDHRREVQRNILKTGKMLGEPGVHARAAAELITLIEQEN